MRNLADTVTRLTRLRAATGFRPRTAPTRLTDLTWSGSNPGALLARVYVPADLPDGAPLVVVLHGCTQTAADYDHGSGWSRLADRHGFALLFPEQQRANNPNLCFNWFLPEDTRRDSGEALSIRQMTDAMVVQRRLDRKRVFVTGLSAGGAMASVMLASYPEVFAGGAVIAGLAYGSAQTMPEAFDRMRGHGAPSEPELAARIRGASTHAGAWPRISVWHGSADATVVSANAESIVGQWRALHGLPHRPTRAELIDGHRRVVWCDADGREVIEHYMIDGMGHGAPVHQDGVDGGSSAGAFMLDAGISSTRRIAAFWDVAPLSAAANRHEPPPVHSRAFDIGGVIGRALRSAGLMK
jgi:poly(hydroxyalkanoate) depolymerase family esterase